LDLNGLPNTGIVWLPKFRRYMWFKQGCTNSDWYLHWYQLLS